MHEATATKTTTLAIDGMTGELCVQRASAALKAVPNVTTQSVTIGSATIEADQKGCDAACAALAAAGFTAAWSAPTLATKKVSPSVATDATAVCPSQQRTAAAATPVVASVVASDLAAQTRIDNTPIELAPAAT